MDVLCVGMFRACSTWQYEVASHLVQQHFEGEPLGYVTGDEYSRLPSNPHTKTAWRILKCHEGHPAFRAALKQGHAVAIHAIRDPRDVVYSMLHKRQLGFETFLSQGMIHQILANHKDWTKRAAGRRLDQRYELIIANPVTSVDEIASFLGISLTRPEAGKIANEYSFEANQKRTRETAESLRATGLDLSDQTNAIIHDDRTLLHWNHMRQGRVGDWRDRATSSERFVMATLLNPWLSANGYAPEPVDSFRRSLPTLEQTRLWWKMAHGRIRCTLRCMAHNYPKTGRLAKGILGLQPRDVARPAGTIPGPHVKPATAQKVNQAK